MSSAYVHNTDAIEAVQAALKKFAHQVDEGLVEIAAESRRMLDWLEHDRPRFWKKRVSVAWDEVEQAKKDLNRCLMYPVGDERPSCTEEREALKKAKAKLAYCEDKQQRLKTWCRDVRHELFEYEGRIAQLKTCGEVDVVNAVAALNRVLAKIEEYQALGSPTRVPKLDVSNLLGQHDEDTSSKDEGAPDTPGTGDPASTFTTLADADPTKEARNR